mgnify:CR=1 FL=1
MRIVFVILIIGFCSLSLAKEIRHSCPVTASGYAALVKMNKAGVEGFMERDTCYYELLNLARDSKGFGLTMDIINLEIHLGASRYESYSEFLEKLAINQPKKILDSLLNVDSRKALRIFEIIEDPLISEGKDIEKSLSRYKNLEKYRVLLSNYYKIQK